VTQRTESDDGYVDPRVARTTHAVIDAASSLLLSEGPDAVTHARIAELTTYSRTTLYKHWPTRTDLLRSAIEKIGNHSLPAEQLTGSLRTDVRRLLDGLVRDLGNDTRSKLIITMLERAQHDPSVAMVRDQMRARIDASFDAVFAAAVESGEVRPDIDVRRAVASLAGSLFFLRFLADATIDDDLADRIVDDFIAANAPR
jgi:AcrR family transcriptional regulator